MNAYRGRQISSRARGKDGSQPSFLNLASAYSSGGQIMISLREIEEARSNIRSLIRRTPLVPSPSLSAVCCGQVYLKLENLQITNSFKIRGGTQQDIAADRR